MDMLKKILCLLAIFCVIGTAAAVSAADDLGNNYYFMTPDGVMHQINGTNTTMNNLTLEEQAAFADHGIPTHNLTDEEQAAFAEHGVPYHDYAKEEQAAFGEHGVPYHDYAKEEQDAFAEHGIPHHGDNTTYAAGEPQNNTVNGNPHHGDNTTYAAGEPQNNTVHASQSHNKLVTGNPLIILLVSLCGAGAALAGVNLRKK